AIDVHIHHLRANSGSGGRKPMELFRKSQNILFVFAQNEDGDFWVHENGWYHRFVWKVGCLRYIRSQSFLPPAVQGGCMYVNNSERLALEKEARRHNLRLTFFASEEECRKRVRRESHDQYIFDRNPPAGFFYTEAEINKRRSRDAEEQ
ncbi:MAG TPA: hypothetical protein VF498_12000, partial [Anaerolineales bacterium]